MILLSKIIKKNKKIFTLGINYKFKFDKNQYHRYTFISLYGRFSNKMLEVFLDALKDSAIVFGFLFVVYFALSFLEPKLARALEHSHKWSPLLGVSFGLIPQCGFSVLAADLYDKKHITIGTLVGVFIATSDEAIPIFLSSVQSPKKMLMILPLLGIKFLVGLGVAYLLDFIFRRYIKETVDHKVDCHCEEITHIGCCGHSIDYHDNHDHEAHHEENHTHTDHDNHNESENLDPSKKGGHCENETKKAFDKEFLHHHVIHPTVHSLKIFAYILVINFIFGTIIYFVGEDKITSFLGANKYLAPILTVIVGLIPNCASSVLISDLYLLGGISFGACVGGLCVNAGLGLFVLLKNVKRLKENLIVILSLLLTGIIVGYIVSLIEWAI